MRRVEGETIALVSEVNSEDTLTARASDARAPTGTVWSDGMPVGLFRGARAFVADAGETGETRFTMKELSTGPLALLITRSIPDTTDSLQRLADGPTAGVEAG